MTISDLVSAIKRVKSELTGVKWSNSWSVEKKY